MPEANQPALDFLLTRRSRPAKTLTTPAPTRAELVPLLTAAARTPDHGKLEPWRFIVLERGGLERIAAMVPERGKALGIDPDKAEKNRMMFADAPLMVAVISSPVENEKVPRIEQVYSAGADRSIPPGRFACRCSTPRWRPAGGQTGCPAGSAMTARSSPKGWGCPKANRWSGSSSSAPKPTFRRSAPAPISTPSRPG